ncbi:unnamed protein product [Lupinus luteus]|uniref:Uncharacterized protein n=1 Tax=Lupinus luteus TaxID=3873 RepID=A0AAV1VY24_LUPLU
MGFSADPRDRSGRTYRHQSNREPAPSDQTKPSPRCSQPSEFHAQSSSPAVMPSNQMIMDELHSLRGYITNRMDALDTQNQQVQYELHCISSKLRSMEVDEDNSEPEVFRLDSSHELDLNQYLRATFLLVDREWVCHPPNYSPPKINSISSENIPCFYPSSPMHNKYYSPSHGN